MAREKDVVLIYFEDNPTGFARIEDISPDVKKDWYHVTLLLLQLPLQSVTWILRDIYIEGAEFTMNGKRVRMEEVAGPEGAEASGSVEKEEEEETDPNPPSPAKVISLNDRKPK